jgi:hypothetical protein
MRQAWAIGLVVALAACSDDSTSVPVTPNDAGTAEVDGGLDTGVDAAPEVTAVTDAGVVTADVAPDVVEVPDVAPDVPADVAPDVPPDVPPDVESKACTDGLAKWQATRAKALACSNNFQCFRPGAAAWQCPCQTFYSDASLDWQNLADLGAEGAKAKCAGTCTTCADFSKQVGKCEAGQCEAFQPTCQQLDQAMASAVEAGKACKQDADCAFYTLDTLACGCKVHLSIPVIGPGKPLFKYVQMLHGAYKALGCTDQIDCACAPPGSGAKCIAGQCQEVP